MTTPELLSTVATLLTPGKGILAADESLATIGKRFAAIDIPSTEENRRAYRELLFTTPGLCEFISGVILFDETLHQKTGGVLMPEALDGRGIIPGIKVDIGTTELPSFADEKVTQGLDGLRERLADYRKRGACFTKWRAVFAIGEHQPTAACVEANARALARFAALSQEAGLVPIVEPEILTEGSHTLARCEEMAGIVLQRVFTALFEQRVMLEGMLLKTAMLLPGTASPQPTVVAEVAAATLRCLRRGVPAAVPGVVFLSGGQSDVIATERLNEICRPGGAPWKLTFSFGRALQDAALHRWHGDPVKTVAAQALLTHRVRCNALAVRGLYSAASEQAAG